MSPERERCGPEPNDHRHGTPNGYNNLGCRCERCRWAWSRYIAARRARNDGAEARDRRRKYALARAAGLGRDEAVRRSHWADPLHSLRS